MNERAHGERRYEYDRAERTISTGKRKWDLHAVPPAVMYGWVREDRVFKGLFEDYCDAIKRGCYESA
jgi:hypothetical protein